MNEADYRKQMMYMKIKNVMAVKLEDLKRMPDGPEKRMYFLQLKRMYAKYMEDLSRM